MPESAGERLLTIYFFIVSAMFRNAPSVIARLQLLFSLSLYVVCMFKADKARVDNSVRLVALTWTRGICLLSGPTQIHLHWIKPQELSNYAGIRMQIQENLKTSLFKLASFALPFIGTYHFTPSVYRNIQQTDYTFDCKFMLYRINQPDGGGVRLKALSKVEECIIRLADTPPSIIFMDEVDSIGSATMVSGIGSGDGEVQRTMPELLNQLDGFEASNKIKVLMATDRIHILDQALLRPARIDRKI
ncbi:26S protease regulatory subunit 8 A [Tanacetum coccineum]